MTGWKLRRDEDKPFKLVECIDCDFQKKRPYRHAENTAKIHVTKTGHSVKVSVIYDAQKQNPERTPSEPCPDSTFAEAHQARKELERQEREEQQ